MTKDKQQDEQLIFELRREYDPLFGKAVDRLSALLVENELLRGAGSELIAKLDECKPHLDGQAVFMHVHGHNYTGPQFGEALEAFRTLLGDS